MIYYKKGNAIVRTSTLEDVEFLKTRLRQSDIDEIWASHHHKPENALRISLETSEICLTITIAEEPIAMFGIISNFILDESAGIWLLASDELDKVYREFAKECKRFIAMMHQRYPILENYVDTRNKTSIRWLKWCGAKIEEAMPYGVERKLFHHFIFEQKVEEFITCATQSL